MILLRKSLVAVLGSALLIAGVAMLLLPGPAIVVIPAADTGDPGRRVYLGTALAELDARALPDNCLEKTCT